MLSFPPLIQIENSIVCFQKHRLFIMYRVNLCVLTKSESERGELLLGMDGVMQAGSEIAS